MAKVVTLNTISKKTKEDVGGVSRGEQGKHREAWVMHGYADLSWCLLHQQSFQRLSQPSLPDTEGDTLQKEISLVSVNVSLERVSFTWFSELHLCLLFLRI